MPLLAGECVTETFGFDGGRQVTAYVPPRPPEVMPPSLPRFDLVAGTHEQFFLDNATLWANALRAAGADVEMKERDGSHGGAFWRAELA